MIEPFQDRAPSGAKLTDYDKAHIKLYMRLLDAAETGAHWTEVVATLFGVDPSIEPLRAKNIHDSHLARARWMTGAGYRQLLSPDHW
ncbi:DUF2285 domain-containing protein [Sphingobium sp.]|uniref:DNA -binding domain-containing protein n=1 Tax=Sphingobium sp. TaxID=1912891 RepID=UPI000DB067B1|nr:DUF2285 domain-containing protein [Sphingobium sp.]PZU68696.1 MAG: DUF2285 domain-containing protein [Sphingobium sp.]